MDATGVPAEVGYGLERRALRDAERAREEPVDLDEELVHLTSVEDGVGVRVHSAQERILGRISRSTCGKVRLLGTPDVLAALPAQDQ